MGVTIKDIAQEAGVSVTTVSRVLNNKPDVSDETKRKINKIIDELGYNPNSMARGLVLQKTFTIGLIIPDISNPFFPEIARGVEDAARKLGYSVLFYNTDNHHEEEKKAIDVLKGKQVDGLIVSLSIDNSSKLKELYDNDFPVVQIDRKVSGTHYTSITIDNTLSSYKATSNLIEMGHRRIAHLAGDLGTQTAKERLVGYKNALVDHKIEINEDFILYGNYTKDPAHNEIRSLLKRKQRPTAIFAANDLMAVSIYKAIYECGLEIPADISVIGHDNIELSSLVTPALSTMAQPKYKMGQLAAVFLIKDIEGKDYNHKDIVLDTKLVERESSAGLIVY